MACLRICPAEAIRIRNKKAVMLEDKCIDCGECVKVCKSGAIVPLTNTFSDFARFKYIIAIPSPALYTQFDRNVKPKTVLSSLKRIGFDEVIDLTTASNFVINAVAKYIDEYKGSNPLISTFCPTCVKIIQTRYPELIDNIIPVMSPMEFAAKMAREETSKRLGFKENEIGIIYITPCPSKTMVMLQKSDTFYTDYDGAIPISEMYNTLYTAVQEVKRNSLDDFEHFDISGFGLNIIRLGGIGYMLKCDNFINVSGISNVIYILDEIEKGKLHNVRFVEMHGCPEGCLGGPMTVENMYIARTNLLNLIDYFGETKIPVGKKELYKNNGLILEDIYHPVLKDRSVIDIKKAIERREQRKKILEMLPKIDCGACGSPTCEKFAEDVINKDAKFTDCIIIENLNLKKKQDK